MEVYRPIKFANETKHMYISEPSECPRCGRSIKPRELNVQGIEDNDRKLHASFHYLCPGCSQTFVAYHDYSGLGSKLTLAYIGPCRFAPRVFDPKFTEVAPRFVTIYNQALEADSLGLDEIAGIGYRKALEFLIKDYLIYKNPDDAEDIGTRPLAQCIQSISDEDIRATASRSTWLGNDQTHYVQKFDEFDLEHLKKLLDATIYWVSMKFTTEFALSIDRR